MLAARDTRVSMAQDTKDANDLVSRRASDDCKSGGHGNGPVVVLVGLKILFFFDMDALAAGSRQRRTVGGSCRRQQAMM